MEVRNPGDKVVTLTAKNEYIVVDAWRSFPRASFKKEMSFVSHQCYSNNYMYTVPGLVIEKIYQNI